MKNLYLPKAGRVLKRADAIICSWCFSGIDPAPRFICESCHRKFKLLLCGTAWARHRRYLLATPEYAICLHCKMQDVITASLVIDHIKPWSLFPSLFWDETNHQALCQLHHNQKTLIDGSTPNKTSWGKP